MGISLDRAYSFLLGNPHTCLKKLPVIEKRNGTDRFQTSFDYVSLPFTFIPYIEKNAKVMLNKYVVSMKFINMIEYGLLYSITLYQYCSST